VKMVVMANADHVAKRDVKVRAVKRDVKVRADQQDLVEKMD
jgi:hypothetical protein